MRSYQGSSVLFIFSLIFMTILSEVSVICCLQMRKPRFRDSHWIQQGTGSGTCYFPLLPCDAGFNFKVPNWDLKFEGLIGEKFSPLWKLF